MTIQKEYLKWSTFLLLTNPLWIQKYLQPESRSKWKRLFDSELERNGGEATLLKENLNKKDVNNLKISDPFVKENL